MHLFVIKFCKKGCKYYRFPSSTKNRTNLIWRIWRYVIHHRNLAKTNTRQVCTSKKTQ